MPTWSTNDLLNLGKTGANGGGTLQGGTVASDSLTLRSTTNATLGRVIVSESTASSSTTTGALVVAGGVGIGGAVNAGAISAGVATVGGTVNNYTITTPSTGSTLSIANGKTLTVTNGAVLNGSGSIAFGAGGTVGYTTATQTWTSKTFTNPTLNTAPVLGDATISSWNNVVVTAPATSSTLTLGNTKSTTISNTVTFTGTDGSTIVTGSGGTLGYTSNHVGSFASTPVATFYGILSGVTGTAGNLVFATAPTFTGTVTIDTASATTMSTTATANNYQIAGTRYLGYSEGTAGAPGALLIGPTNTSTTTSCTNTTILGYGAGGSSMTSGTGSITLIGAGAGSAITSGHTSTFIGFQAGNAITTGAQNTIIGATANASSGTTGSIALGFGATATANNQFALPSGITSFKATGLTTLSTAGSSTLTLPSGPSTLATTSTAQTLTNKTLTSPSLTGTPTLGIASVTTLNGLQITGTTGSLTVASGKTLEINASFNLTGTNGSTVTATGTGGTVAYTSDNVGSFASTTSAQLYALVSDPSGTGGSAVFSTSPAMTGIVTMQTLTGAALNSTSTSGNYQLGGSTYLAYTQGSAAAPGAMLVGPTNTSTVTAGASGNIIIGYGSGGTAMTAVAALNNYIGYLSGANSTSAQYNVCVGANTASNVTTGSSHTFIGDYAGYQLTTGYSNTYIGVNAGRYGDGTSFTNTFVGYAAGIGSAGVSTGFQNVFVGASAGQNYTSAYNCVCVGAGAGINLTTGTANVMLGLYAGFNITTVVASVFVGNQAGYSNTSGGGNTYVGCEAGRLNATGIANTFVGRIAGYAATGGENTAMGHSAFGTVATNTSNFNTCMGYVAGNATTSGSSNTFIGAQAGLATTTGGLNTFIGTAAGIVYAASASTFVGVLTGQNATTGGVNTYIGYGAEGSTSTRNFAIALGAGASATADNQFAVADTTTHFKFPGLEATGTGNPLVQNTSNAFIRANAGITINASGTASTSTTTGALVITGGLGVTGTLTVGGAIATSSVAAFSVATPTLGTSSRMIFNGTTDQNDWTTVTNLIRSTSTGADSVLVADVYSGGRTIVTLDSGNNYGGKVLLEPGSFPRCHLYMRDTVNVDKVNTVGYNSPIYADVQLQAKLVAGATAYAATGAASGFEWAIGMDYFGRTLVVGGPNDNSGAGAAWFYNRAATGSSFDVVGGGKQLGTQQTGAALFGNVVAVSADNTTVVIGGYNDNTGAGAIWVFNTLGTALSSKITPTGGAATIHFGTTVAIDASGQTIAVGASTDNSNVGAVWVFYKASATVWTQVGSKLVGTGATGAANQGGAIALSYDGNTLISAGPADNTNFGAIWVFSRTGGSGSGSTWTQKQPKIVATGASAASPTVGTSICLSGNGRTIAAGAGNESGGNAVWIFEKGSNGFFNQLQPKLFLETLGTSSAAGFGSSLSISADGTTLAIGAASLGNPTLKGAMFLYFRSGNGYYTRRGLLADALIGTGGTGASRQGGLNNNGTVLSGLGNILATGGQEDNSAAGAVWVYR